MKSIESRDNRTTNVVENHDRLLLLVPAEPTKLGIVVAPEEREDFADGDVVRFTEPYKRLDSEGRGLALVSPANCEKITDSQIAEAYRRFIWGI